MPLAVDIPPREKPVRGTRRPWGRLPYGGGEGPQREASNHLPVHLNTHATRHRCAPSAAPRPEAAGATHVSSIGHCVQVALFIRRIDSDAPGEVISHSPPPLRPPSGRQGQDMGKVRRILRQAFWGCYVKACAVEELREAVRLPPRPPVTIPRRFSPCTAGRLRRFQGDCDSR